MIRRKFNFLVLAAIVLSASTALRAGAGGNESGLALLRNSGARSSALGDAFVSMTDDITAMDFNPASLSTLDSGIASLQYEKGFFDDSFGKAMVGLRTASNHAFGFSVGTYDSGKASLYDGVNAPHSATAEQDRLASVGYGFHWLRLDWGASAKYLSSTLAETNSASALSAEAGLQYKPLQRLEIGASGPIAQSSLKYADVSEKLPRVYRAGMSWSSALPLPTGDLPILLLFDVPYDANNHSASAAFGAETRIGFLSLRAGVNSRSNVQQVSMGAGFQFHRINLDYSFGLANTDTFDSVHKVNFSYRFDDFRTHELEHPRQAKAPTNVDYHIYEVKQGETLETISKIQYGSADRWQEIYEANKQMYANPSDIKAGARILIPSATVQR